MLLMLLVSVPAMSQSRLSYSLDSITCEFPAEEYSGELLMQSDSRLNYWVLFPDATVCYRFDLLMNAIRV